MSCSKKSVLVGTSKSIFEIHSSLFETLTNFVKTHTVCHDQGHGYEHAEKVTQWVVKIVSDESNDQIEYDILLTSAMLHDVCDYKFESNLSVEKLQEFVSSLLGHEKSLRVMDIINNVSYSKQVKGKCKQLDLKDQHYLDVVRDADRLEALGQTGLERCIEYTKFSGGKVPEDVIKHCHEKLLRLLPEGFIKTKKARKWAKPLHDYIDNWVKKQS